MYISVNISLCYFLNLIISQKDNISQIGKFDIPQELYLQISHEILKRVNQHRHLPNPSKGP